MKNHRYNFPYSNGKELAEKINSILEEYNVPLTLRQVYYRLVALGLKNSQNVYKNLSGKLSRLREDGLVSWDRIIDLNRQPKKESSWTSPQEFFEADRWSYKRDLQQGQKVYLEIWCEKAIAIRHITDKYDVHLLAGGGYRSSSALYEAAERFRDVGKKIVILYLGDFDPSGLDIERDIETRMREVFGLEVDVQRVLLVQQDITDYELLPSPVKPKDTRTSAYIERYGFRDVYELDALKPDVIADRLERAICRNIDLDLYRTQVEKWEEDKVEIERFLDAWDERESY
ncbi:MAG: hypothetical protein NTZ87_02945 [Candidatus Nomurabacteria bacterium]|nr:hypothetical protein [Candidatus Nomurabacteria bacterium]